MAGGDLLYIFAFIILPTAVLVSCIWALLLLRKGALLPVRPKTAYDISQSVTHDHEETDTGYDLVEETGEHTIVESVPTTSAPITATPTAAATVTPTPAAGDPMTLAPATYVRPASEPQAVESPAVEPPTIEPLATEPLATERTQELMVQPVVVSNTAGAHLDLETARDAPTGPKAPNAMPGTRGVAPDATSGVFTVPLDEPPQTASFASRAAEGGTNPTPPPATPAASRVIPAAPDDDSGQSDQPPSSVSRSRRPARRVAQLRTAEEATARPRPRAGQRQNPQRPDSDA